MEQHIACFDWPRHGAPSPLPPYRQELLRWLKSQNPKVLAPLYEAAVMLVERQGFPQMPLLVSHIASELCDQLPDVVEPEERCEHLHYMTLFEPIAKEWTPIRQYYDIEVQPAAGNFEIPLRLARRIDDLVTRHKQRLTARTKQRQLLSHLSRNYAGRADDNARVTAHFEALAKFFKKHRHADYKGKNALCEDEIRTQFEAFEQVLRSFVGDFFRSVEELDVLLERANSGQAPLDADLHALVPRLSTPQHEGYFFSRLQNAAWLPQLESKGLFSHPPQTRDLGEGTVSHPVWFAGRYLARVADKAPKAVAQIFERISTDNASIIADMVDAALKMPTEIAVELLPGIEKGVKDGTLFLAQKETALLCKKFAEGNELDAAIQLAKALFAPDSNPDEVPTRRGRSEYWYQEGLRNVAPVLGVKAPQRFLPLIRDWFRNRLRSDSGTSRGGGDHSRYWYPVVGGGGGPGASVRESLAHATFDSFHRAVSEGAISLEHAAAILGQYDENIFRRMRLALMSRFADKDPSLVRSTILDQSLFKDDTLTPEYRSLVKAGFGCLTQDQREQWITWVDAGPDLAAFGKRVQAIEKREPTQAELDSHRSRYILGWLQPVAEHLPDARKKEVDQLVVKYGTPKPDPVPFTVSVRRPTQMDPDPLAGKPFEAAAAIIRNATREDETRDWFSHSEGLEGALARYVANDTVACSAQAQLLKGTRATYVHTFLGQMTSALQNGLTIEVRAVLALCEWAIAQEPDDNATTPAPRRGFPGPSWDWVRSETVRFIEEVCKRSGEGKPRFPDHSLAEVIWPLLDRLGRVSIDGESETEESKTPLWLRDVHGRAINTLRSQAVAAALNFAGWWHETKPGAEKNAEEVFTFDSPPGLRELLEWQLKPVNRSDVVGSILGSRLRTLHWLDRVWLQSHAGKLLRCEPGQEPDAMGWAAWNAFVVWSSPHAVFLEMFRDQYKSVAERIITEKPSINNHDREPLTRLGEHLMVLYGRGDMTEEDETSLFRPYVLESPPAHRRSAISFVGRSVAQQESLPKPVVDRFQGLWEEYWAGPGPNDAKDDPTAWLFGQWFASGKFDLDWAYRQLLEFTKAVPLPEPDHAVAERLAATAGGHLSDALLVLKSMIDGDTEGWHVHGWEEHAMAVLQLGMKSPADRDVSVELINKLGRRGFMKFGELLEIKP